MVQEVFADDGRSGPVEVHRGDIGRVVRDEEVAVHAREDAQEDGTGDAQLIGQREEGDDHGTLAVDEHGDEEEDEGDGPRVVRNEAGEHGLHLVHVVAEVGVGHPGDAVDGDHRDHAGLPDGAGDGLLRGGLAEHDVAGGGHEHDDLDADVHLRDGDRLGDGLAVGRVEHLAEREAHDHEEGAQEHEHGRLGLLGDDLVQGGGGTAVHVGVLLGIGLALLEFRVHVEVLAALEGSEGGAHEAAEAGRDGDHQDLRDRDHVAVRIGDGDEGDDGGGDRRAGDTHLRGDGSHAAGALGPDVLLQGDVADDGHDRIDHMARAHEDGQEEGHERAQEGDVVRMLAEHPFRDLDHPVHTARRLEGASAGDGRDDDVDDVRRRGSGLEPEAEHEDGQADAGDGAEGQGTVAGTHVERCEDDQQLDNHDKAHIVVLGLEIIQVEARLLVEAAACLTGETLHDELAGPVHPRGEQVTADAGVVPPAGGDVQVQVHVSILPGYVAGQVGDLHLLGEGLVHVLLRGRIQEAESRLADGADAIDGAAADVQFPAEGGERRGNLYVVVQTEDIFVSGNAVLVHSPCH